jgi:hypothetical protein
VTCRKNKHQFQDSAYFKNERWGIPEGSKPGNALCERFMVKYDKKAGGACQDEYEDTYEDCSFNCSM